MCQKIRREKAKKSTHELRFNTLNKTQMKFRKSTLNKPSFDHLSLDLINRVFHETARKTLTIFI